MPMRSALRRAQPDDRHGFCLRFGSTARGLLAGAAVAVIMSSGCAPMYYDGDFAAYDEAATGPRAHTRPKPRVALPKLSVLRPQAPPDCGETRAAGSQEAANESKRLASATLLSAAMSSPTPRPDTGGSDLALRIKLEYEREC